MRAIWTNDEASYHGRLVDFAPIRSWPKPVQRPGPPVLIGGAGAGVLKRAVAYGDGWLPVVTPVLPPGMTGRMVGLDELERHAAELARLAGEAGAPPTVTVTDLAEPALVASSSSVSAHAARARIT
jgi:alkanesulfonate monooxygenase SsuD/methylene tetrahydromethanopterin reductase-like flavin-dependent oxidoreductase (luciferase family)